MTARDGRISKLEQVFLRGGQVKFIVLPEILKNAPLFKKPRSLDPDVVDGEEEEVVVALEYSVDLV
eukprot:gene3076-3785_t